MTSRFLVTGSQGFLGRYVIVALAEMLPDAEIFGIGRSAEDQTAFIHTFQNGANSIKASLPADLRRYASATRVHYFRCDLRDRSMLARAVTVAQPTAILHLAAALRGNDWSELVHANIEGALAFSDVLKEVSFNGRLIVASSGSVYGPQPPNHLPTGENACVNPIEPYAVSKRISEQIFELHARVLEIDLVLARIFNLSGPGLQERHLPAQIAHQIARIEAGLAEPVLRTRPLTTTRDIIDVRDAARAIVALARTTQPPAICNIATGRETGMRTVLDILRRASKREFRHDVRELKTLHQERAVARIDVMNSIGFRAAVSLDQSLNDLLSYARSVHGGRLLNKKLL